MRQSKLSKALMPKMKPHKKSKKMGLLTSPNRRMIALRIQPKIIELWHELVKSKQKKGYYGITKTDLLELGLMYISGISDLQFKRAVKEYLEMK